PSLWRHKDVCTPVVDSTVSSMVVLFLFFATKNGSSTKCGRSSLFVKTARSFPGCVPCSAPEEPAGSSGYRNGRRARFCSLDSGTSGSEPSSLYSRSQPSSEQSRSFRSCQTAGTRPAGGFPAMQRNGAFLMKEVVLLAVSIYLLSRT